MHDALVWIRGNPVLFAAVLWPLFTGILSFAYRLLDRDTRWHSFFAMLVSAGLDVPGILAELRRFLQGPPTDGGYRPIAKAEPRFFDDQPPPPTTRKTALKWFLCVGAASALCGCTWFTPNHVEDVSAVTSCFGKCIVDNEQEIHDIFKRAHGVDGGADAAR